ncbi:hypothetical protein [Desulfolutivibrio sulfoxidireducens]|uniref:hypothetical protein n=1 Tax=Desulfolutivibrio sulfoxidireducens TaxID=2773299 RepID=UPI00159E5EA6|nr:hypothetical protein [Desulfolutivibrio sulfoxidireducens]QLA17792.1 hypothetical protein GD605_17760 [Desulfolutivibrio sulfoxidireducens]QLA21370.1 hypothetical protein GD604_17380 [Desulfolutivibrio sulfoxidireducens]
MRSLLVAGILVVAVFIYLAVAARLDAPAAVPSGQARFQAVTEGVRNLEARRRNMLAGARLTCASYGAGARSAPGFGAAYARGYRDGFEQGYATGSYLSSSARPNPLFFPIPASN